MTIAAALTALIERKAIPGAVVLVTSPERTLTVECAGHADLLQQRPMRPDTLFWIASISKPITAVALTMLIEEGRVQLDDPVERFIPEFKTMWVASEATEQRMVLTRARTPITVRQVITHTSGLPFMSRSEPGRIDTLTLRESVISYAGSPLVAEPGTIYSYSNAGTNTAGRIIELASGMSYDSFLQERLLDPLGMRDTCMRPTAAQQERLATAYACRSGPSGDSLEEIPISQCTYPLDRADRRSSPAGGFFSTAADLGRLAQMLLREGELDGRRYLAPASVRLMTTSHTPQVKDIHHGLALSLDPVTGTFAHGGALGTMLLMDPRRQLGVVYLVQRQGDPKDFPPVLAAVNAAYSGGGSSAAGASR